MSNKNQFRAFYKADLEMGEPVRFETKRIEGESIEFYAVDEPDIIYPFDWPFLDDDWIILQYTGLKDKKGLEICEGDILGYGDVTTGFVEFSDGSFVFNQGESNQGLNRLCLDRTKRLEVIGDIYETPELLEVN